MEGLTRPEVYKNNPGLRAIIDCTEFYIQKPSLPSSQRHTHSSYKSRNTFKLFISLSPMLHINFISRLYSGCISDKEITKKCGFLEALEPGDHVMADKGFNIQDLLALNHVRLIAPPIMYTISYPEPSLSGSGHTGLKNDPDWSSHKLLDPYPLWRSRARPI